MNKKLNEHEIPAVSISYHSTKLGISFFYKKYLFCGYWGKYVVLFDLLLRTLEKLLKVHLNENKPKSLCLLFYQIFIISPNDSTSKTAKCFLFHLKGSFHSQNIQIFVFLSFHLFLPVAHCFRGWSELTDTINCLIKSSITHFFISWEGKKVWHWNFVYRCSIK